MSLKRLETTLVVKINSSRKLFILMLLMHALAILMLWSLHERLGLLVAGLMPFLVISFILILRRYIFFKSKYSIIEIISKNHSEYVLLTNNGERISAVLRRGSYVQPWLIILNFKLKQWPWYISVPLLSDSADQDALRCLRVRLRTMRDGDVKDLV